MTFEERAGMDILASEKLSGAVRRIITTSAVDGPGNRAVVFLQGCQLRCRYCHNPETIPMPDGLTDFTNERRGGRSFERNADADIRILKTADFQGWLWVYADEVLELLRPYLPFVSGVTISGGECTQQSEFLIQLVGVLKTAGIHVILDTNGQIPEDVFLHLNDLVDGWIFDAKSLEENEYRMLTGEELSEGNWWKNLSGCALSGKLIEVRTVIVPGLLNNYRNVWLMAEWLSKNSPLTAYRLIGFRNHGVTGALANSPSPTKDQMEELKKLALSLGVEKVTTV